MVDKIIQNEEVSTETSVEIPVETSIATASVEPSVEPVLEVQVETPLETPVENSGEVILDKSPVVSEPIQTPEDPSIESEQTLKQDTELINPMEEVQTEQVIKKEEVEVPQAAQPQIQTLKQENIVSKAEQTQASPFLCNSLSDSFLKNIKNFKEIAKKGRETILLRKQKRLDRIMTLFLKKNHITLSDVEKFLRVTEKTASRYIVELKKQNKVKKSGKDDRGAFLYVKL